MDPKKPSQPEGSVPKKQFVPVKSKYLDFTKKSSSQSDNSGPSTSRASKRSVMPGTSKAPATKAWASSTPAGNTSQTVKSATTLRVPSPGRKAKTSTPTKDVSLFAPDISVVPVANKPKVKKVKEENDADDAELLDNTFKEYNKSLLLQAMNILLEEQRAKFAESADVQLAMLQQAVDESEGLLADLNLQLDAATAVDDIQKDVALATEAYNEIVEPIASMDSEKFDDLTTELNNVLDQLPCKNVRVPTSKEDFDEIQNAAASLTGTVADVLQKNKEEVALTAKICEEVTKIDSVCTNLRETDAGIKKLLPIASSKVLEETAKRFMNSNFANAKITF